MSLSQTPPDSRLPRARTASSDAAPARSLPLPHWMSRQRLHIGLAVVLVALLASIVPGVSTVMPREHAPALTSLALPLPPLRRVSAGHHSDPHWQDVTIAAGQTLGAILSDMHVSPKTLQQFIHHPSVRQHLTRLRPGTRLGIAVDEGGQLYGLRFDRSDSEQMQLLLEHDEIVERSIERALETRTVLISGNVGRSLFHSARRLGLAGHVINTLTDDIFQYDIDFSRDMTANDRFSVLVEQTWREGELIRTGPVQAAVFTAKGRPFTAVRFEYDGKVEYFNAEGRPLKKSFMRNPIQYARLSSRFGMRRHPVLGTMREHKGVDYAAPTGTPIMAAGDARVVSAGWQRGYGNTVVLDHGRGYSTLYGHMSRTAALKAGQQVRQGEVIGYVGATGMATGPHLHYEFRVNGVHQDPLKHMLPPPDPLSADALLAFLAQSTPTLERMAEVEGIVFARPLRRDTEQHAFAVHLPPLGPSARDGEWGGSR